MFLSGHQNPTIPRRSTACQRCAARTSSLATSCWAWIGGCVYIDLQHLEVCLPEVRGAHDFVAAWHAMLRIGREAMEAANARLPEGCRIEVPVNNSDGLGSSMAVIRTS